MNNSIYKKKIAFKQSLPQYKDGGKKFAAGLAGFATKIPMLGQIVDPMVSNTKLAKEFDTAFNAGQMAGGVANTVANAAVGNVAGAISSGADTVQEGLEMGSSIASNNNNLERANRLNTASTAFGGLEQGAGMFNTSQFGKGFNPTQMMGDANIPIMMRNGGMIKRADGSYSKRGLWDNIRANAGSGKKPTPEMLEQERKIKAKYEDGGSTQDTLFVNNPNDPRLRAYQDSLSLYNTGEREFNEGVNFYRNYRDGQYNLVPVNNPNSYHYQATEDIYRTPLRPSLFYESSLGSDVFFPRWQKPTQPVSLKKEEKPIDTSKLKYKVSEPEMKKLPEQSVGKMKSGRWQKDPNYPGIEMSLDEPGVYRDKQGVFTGEVDNKVPGKLNVLERFKDGGGLSRSEDYGSKKKPYPNVSSGDFAGGNRSYPIPTKADAVDALRLAGLHGRSDVKSKVYAKYPSLKKEDGGYTYSTEGAKQGSNYDVINPKQEPHDNTIIDPKKWIKGTQLTGDLISYVNPALGRMVSSPGDVLDIIENPTQISNYITPFARTIPTKVAFNAKNRDNIKAVNAAINTGILVSDLESTKKQNGGLLQYDNGGPADLIKYNLPTHEDGGGAIDANGKLVSPNSPLAQAELEKTETLDTKQNYVFSDTLKPMKSKLTFADLSKKLENKYKGKTDDISVNSKNKELERLAQANEEMRLAKEAKSNPNPLMMAKNGGKLPKYFDGGTKQANWWEQPLGSGTVDTLNTVLPTEFGTNNKTVVPPVQIPSWITGKASADEILNVSQPNNDNLLRAQSNQRRMDNSANNINNTVTENNPFKMTTGDKMQLGAGALSGITNLAMGLKKPETYASLTSPYFGAGLNDMNQEVRFNTNPILMNRNVGMNQINQGSTSDAVRRANLQSLTSNTNRALGELAEKEALANIGIKQDLGKAKIGVGQQDLASREAARAMNIQSKAIAQNLRAKGLEQIYGSVSDVGKGMNQSRTNTIQLNVLNSLASQYGIDPKTLEIYFKQQGIKVV